jgi:hypothetical protein
MLSDMGWTDPRQGILPLGLVRVLHTAACRDECGRSAERPRPWPGIALL